MIPLSVIIRTKNEERNIGACLAALKNFGEVIVVDSHSTDRTADIAQDYGARVELFRWDGTYPKKSQWCLDNLSLAYDRVLFMDADERMTEALAEEIAALDWAHDGYFIKGQPVWHGHALKHGLWNNKLALFDRYKFHYPVVDDLDLPGSFELEGHYQPLPKTTASIGQLSAPVLHDCADEWEARHTRYAQWEAAMVARGAYPRDPIAARERAKSLFRVLRLRGPAVFAYGYLWKGGFLDGAAGLSYARAKAAYYNMIVRANRAPDKAA